MWACGHAVMARTNRFVRAMSIKKERAKKLQRTNWAFDRYKKKDFSEIAS